MSSVAYVSRVKRYVPFARPKRAQLTRDGRGESGREGEEGRERGEGEGVRETKREREERGRERGGGEKG